MNLLEFEITRTFRVWAYSVSHRQLLLRSPSEEGGGTRVDVLFKGVDELHIQTVASGLSIQEAALDSELDSGQKHSPKKFVLKSAGWIGFIVAGSVAVHEDNGSYDEPSALLSGLR